MHVYNFYTTVAGLCMICSASNAVEASTITTYSEIAVGRNVHIDALFSKLTPQERVFIYYMMRASLAGNNIMRQQMHRHAALITEIFEYILERKEALKLCSVAFDWDLFLKDVETYLVYLWTNHSQYFMREHEQEKRTPERLKLKTLTHKNLSIALSALAFPNADEVLTKVEKSIFDQEFEPTKTIPDSIDKSAVNFYDEHFTDADFEACSGPEKSAINSFFYIDLKTKKPQVDFYGLNGKYATELDVIVYWLKKAYDHAVCYPNQFDIHLVKSLDLLIQFFKTGDEALFKQHSVEWLKSDSRVDYTFGFIETYDDPKSYRGTFESDVTIKSIDIKTLKALLPSIEQKLPIAREFMRDNLENNEAGPIINASINVKAFAAGGLGPSHITIAYCLPNYEEIRSEHGSKQIIYHAEKGIGELLSPEIAKRLNNAQRHYEWFKMYDPEMHMMRDIFMLEVILHETMGHGSGKLTRHIFKKGDALTIGGITYNIGDTIPVTSNNIQEFLAGYDHSLEELRAEIMALLASIVCYDELAASGMLKEWPKKVGKDAIINYSIISMCRGGLRRYIAQPDNAVKVSGAHAQANMTILNYLLKSGAVELLSEHVLIEGQSYTILDIDVVDQVKAIDVITKLANEVQRIKSTGDGQAVKELIEEYGSVINMEHMHIMKRNNIAAVGDIKVFAMQFPEYAPVKNNQDEIVDITMCWYSNIVEEYLQYKQLALSKNA